ncbi:MAG: hypothetical protein RBS72_04590 [Sedimentisphaerales bacterium]|jgi:hypothetical protein|nr:hypothetical protein [Sedimentisphaerales bacterium]HNY77636.1 hypothetical protein [Sedimentisphaerales bacterium]HOC61969.1 hypothetical protein [Sedimentisphaerales bacterium]HOH63811.1 hypothetical protein [Sedimentisphaerales bacterium]HPY49902.1 hypothetical protein [Sedimentisphaerales bacterium]
MRKHTGTGRTRWLRVAIILTTCAAAIAAAAPGAQTEPNAVTITTTKLEVTDETLVLCYRITNHSDTDVWLCDSMNAGAPWSVEVHLDKDGETLLVQRRLDLAMEGFGEQPIGHYVRVRSGEHRSEMISLALPINPQHVLSSSRSPRNLLDTTRLAVQIGYYAGDLPRRVLNLIDQDERSPAEKTERMPLPAYPHTILEWFGGTLHFTTCNERVRDRSEHVLIPWSDRTFREDGVLGVAIDGIRIPYLAQFRETPPPDLSTCDRVAIQFQPSALPFFFPYDGQQELLSEEERDFLCSQKTVAVDDSHSIQTLAGEVKKGLIGAFVKQGASAQVLCTHGVREVTSLMVYDDMSIVTRGGHVFRYPRGLPSLRMSIPQIQAIDLRLQCAGNLEDLWHRLRLYRVAKYAAVDLDDWWDRYDSQAGRTAYPAESSGQERMAYPPSGRWCDVMLRAYRVAAPGDSALKPHKCPGADEGKCHYAMNPNCKPDSPGDMVLLFEAKAGWNQHGGPELFTFDNHDPKGGCVLLNDGTVKFIRSEEELHALRWK